MFTGLVSDVGTVASVSGDGDLRRIAIRASYDPATIALGSVRAGLIRSLAETAGTSTLRSIRSSSGPEMRAW